MKISGIKASVNVNFDLGEMEVSIPEVMQMALAERKQRMEERRAELSERLVERKEERAQEVIEKTIRGSYGKPFMDMLVDAIKDRVVDAIKNGTPPKKNTDNKDEE